MANDFYIPEDNSPDWDLMEQEFHEWQVFHDVVAIIETKGLYSVLKTITNMMEEKGIK
jgi:hypothetical protein